MWRCCRRRCSLIAGARRVDRATREFAHVWWWLVPRGDLGAFGPGVGLYFSFLLQVAILMLCCAAASVPAVVDHASLFFNSTMPPTLYGTVAHYPGPGVGSRPAASMDRAHVWVSEALVCATLACFVVMISRSQRRTADAIDEHNATTQDYSICILRPPVCRAAELRSYFDTFVLQERGAVVAVTLKFRDDPVLRAALVAAHELERHRCALSRIRRLQQPRQLEQLGQLGQRARDSDLMRESSDGALTRPSCLRRVAWACYVGRDEAYHEWRIRVCRRALSRAMLEQGGVGRSSARRRSREPSRGAAYRDDKRGCEAPECAFVTFETERQQRAALQFMRRGWCERASTSEPLGRCRAFEAPEPSDIIWEESLGPSVGRRARRCASWGLTLFLSGCCFYVTTLFHRMRARGDADAVVSGLRISSPSDLAFDGLPDVLAATAPGAFVALVNWAAPLLLPVLVACMDGHPTHSSRESSLLVRLAVMRTLNVVVAPLLAAPTAHLTRPGVLQRVQILQISNALCGNLLRAADPAALVARYVLGALARTPVGAEELWRGPEWSLSERYSDVLTTVALATTFGTLLPSAYLLAAVHLAITYWVDKFLLLRHCRRTPVMDEGPAAHAPAFLLLCLVSHLVVAGWIFANWPLAAARAAPSAAGLHDLWRDKAVWAHPGRASSISCVALAACVVLAATLAGARRGLASSLASLFVGTAAASGPEGAVRFSDIRPPQPLYQDEAEAGVDAFALRLVRRTDLDVAVTPVSDPTSASGVTVPSESRV